MAFVFGDVKVLFGGVFVLRGVVIGTFASCLGIFFFFWLFLGSEKIFGEIVVFYVLRSAEL